MMSGIFCDESDGYMTSDEADYERTDYDERRAEKQPKVDRLW